MQVSSLHNTGLIEKMPPKASYNGSVLNAPVIIKVLASVISFFIFVVCLLLIIISPVRAAFDPYLPATERLPLPYYFNDADTKFELFIDEQNMFYVLNLKANQLYKFNGVGQLLQKYELKLPAEVLEQDASLWVSSSRIYIKPADDSSVWVFSKQGEPEKTVTLKINQDGYYKFLDLAVDQRGYLYIIEGVSGQIEVFDDQGIFNGVFTKNGDRANQLQGMPESIFLDDEGSLYIASVISESNKSRIFKYSYQGQLLETFQDLPAHRYANIYADANENLFAVSPEDSLVVKFDRRGRQICQFRAGCSSGIAVSKQGLVYLDPGRGGLISQFLPSETVQLVERGNEAYLDQYWERAERYFKQALILDNQLDYAHLVLGEVYFQQHRWISALAEFKFLRDHWRYSQALTSFRSYLLITYWPLILLLVLGILLGVVYLAKVIRKATLFRHISFLSVIWKPVKAMQQETRIIKPAIAGFFIALFAIIHYFSWYFSNPIFAGDRQVFSWHLFSRGVFLIIGLLFVWVWTVYKVGELFQGLARYSYILAGTALCLVPLMIGEPFIALVSHLLTYDELWVYISLDVLIVLWAIVLVLVKIRFTEDFSWGKTFGMGLLNLSTTLLILLFLFFLIGVNQQLSVFLTDVFKEVWTRFTT